MEITANTPRHHCHPQIKKEEAICEHDPENVLRFENEQCMPPSRWHDVQGRPCIFQLKQPTCSLDLSPIENILCILK